MSKKRPAITRCPTPIIPEKVDRPNEEKIETIATHFRAIMETLGLDLSDPSLQDTPERVAKMYVNEIFSGLDPENFPEVSFFDNAAKHLTGSSQMITLKVHFISFCEHHFVPMQGYAYIGYLPGDKLIGLSKIPRIVKYFSQRPQLQERLTGQIADSLVELLETEDVAVQLRAKHYCVLARGVEDTEGMTTSQIYLGKFHEEAQLRDEFLRLI